MKHATRFWQKKLGRSPKARDNLLKTLVTQLIEHEQINTTVAKAKFVQHKMEELINLAKRGGEKELKKIGYQVFSQETHVPKLVNIIAPRFESQSGGYVRILRNQFHSSGSDRAPKAVVELVGNPRDIVHGMSQMYKTRVQQQLSEVEELKYRKMAIELIDPQTEQVEQVFKLEHRHDLPGSMKKRLNIKEVHIRKKLQQFGRSDKFYQLARQKDLEQTQKFPELADKIKTPRAVKAVETVEIAQEPVVEQIEPVAEKAQEEEKPKPSSSMAEKLFGGKFWKRLGF
ncbi:ribosomal protein L17 [Gorgonomyces haynaldii]|nr:ribosomal protein L17 [Gorgonomyces haynaldii]